MARFCGQERNMLHYITTTLSVDIRMVVGMSQARHRIVMRVACIRKRKVSLIGGECPLALQR
jgi:hypothetical protein